MELALKSKRGKRGGCGDWRVGGQQHRGAELLGDVVELLETCASIV